MWFVKQPEYYDVIVTENLFGDIITDLAAIIQGGLGIAAGGNINPEGVSMFEPTGGSTPKYTGKNVINPRATICAGGMMLDTPTGDLYLDIMTHLGSAASYETVEADTKTVAGVRIRVATPGALYRLKKDTIRPLDHQDAAMLRQAFNLEDDRP